MDPESNVDDNTQFPGWRLVKEEETGIIVCNGRIPGYRPVYVDEAAFVEKLIQHIHEKIMHLGVANTMAAIHERLIQELKKTLYKTLGKKHLTFRQLRTVILDIERNLNNRPLTYIEGDQSDQQVLTPNVILWGQNAYTIGSEDDFDEEQTSRMQKRLKLARQHAWSRWQREYVHGLMEFHRINKGQNDVPQVGEVVLIVGEEKNHGLWMKARVLRHVKGKDRVMRGAILLHKGNHIERPIQLLCPLEIRRPLQGTEHNASTQEDNGTQDERQNEERRKKLDVEYKNS